MFSTSGSISWVTATPADVVKSRMQADTQLQRKYRGILHCIIHSYKTEGVQVSEEFTPERDKLTAETQHIEKCLSQTSAIWQKL